MDRRCENDIYGGQVYWCHRVTKLSHFGIYAIPGKGEGLEGLF